MTVTVHLERGFFLKSGRNLSSYGHLFCCVVLCSLVSTAAVLVPNRKEEEKKKNKKRCICRVFHAHACKDRLSHDDLSSPSSLPSLLSHPPLLLFFVWTGQGLVWFARWLWRLAEQAVCFSSSSWQLCICGGRPLRRRSRAIWTTARMPGWATARASWHAPRSATGGTEETVSMC